MIAITPPKIVSKEVAQKQATGFPRQDLLTARNLFTPNFQGSGLDENLKPKSPPPRGHRQRQNGSAGFQPNSFEMPMASLMSGASSTVFGHGVCPDALTGFRR